MKYFKELIVGLDQNYTFISQDGTKSEFAIPLKLRQRIIQETTPFVFNTTLDSLHDTAKLLIPILENEISSKALKQYSLELPFQTCFFELIEKQNTKFGEFLGVLTIEEGSEVSILLFINHNGQNKIVQTDDKKMNGENALLVYSFLHQLNSCKTGISNPREFVKIKSNGVKINHRINKVIYVSPKTQAAKVSSEVSHHIDWTHRFWRRGNWAHFWKDETRTEIDTSRIGKNRNGEYVERGRTWRIETIVHKEKTHLPLVNKLRVVNSKQKGGENESRSNQ